MPARRRLVRGTGVAVLLIAAGGLIWAWARPGEAESSSITWFRLRAPGPQGHDIEQASDLCFGRIGRREGLWIVCDRNGGASAGRIYRIAAAGLAAAAPEGTIVADEEFVVSPPSPGWAAFRGAHPRLPPAVLDHIQQRVEAGLGNGDGMRLDLEAVTIGHAPGRPDEQRLFVVAEEPYSLVLQLDLPEEADGSGQTGSQGSEARRDRSTQAVLVAAYRYVERDTDHGVDFNDGLEGLAYAGKPGLFWWAEEGTRLHRPDAHPRLFFAEPRIGLAQLRDGMLAVDEEASAEFTQAVRRLKGGEAQTLNALATTNHGDLLAVDRNGGWVLRVDPRQRKVSRWFSVYDVAGSSLRDLLATFPGRRRMPYVSIEGIAVDDAQNVWLVDDPAMPEAFRASCLVRIAGPGPKASSGPAEPGNG